MSPNPIFTLKSSDDEKYILQEIDRGKPLYLLWGGLGNQLFGLVAAFSLARNGGGKVIIDISNCEHINESGIPDSLLLQDYEDWAIFVNSGSTFLTDLKASARSFSSHIPNPQGAFFGWNPSFSEVMVSGLFHPIRKSRERGINSSNIVGIHLRRGDYEKYWHLGCVPKSYYSRAVKLARSRYPNPQFIFYSDDEAGARKIAKSLALTYVDGNKRDTLSTFKSMLDLDFLISANSTFSFWAAFFGDFPAIYPYPWFKTDFNWGKSLIRPYDQELHISRIPFIKNAEFKLSVFLHKSKSRLISFLVIIFS